MKTRYIVLLGALLLVAPAVTTLPGCGGGNGPNLNVQVLNGLPLNLGDGQNVRIDLNINLANAAINGVLHVLAGPPPAPLLGNASRGKATGVGTRAIDFLIPVGDYPFTGSFTPPRGFTVEGDAPAPVGHFTITGQVPTQTQTGSFTFSAAGQSVSGTIPALQDIIPTATPTQNGDDLVGTISGQQDANVSATSFDLPLTSSGVSTTGDRTFRASFEQSGTPNTTLTFEVQLPTGVNLAAGQTYSLATSTGGSLTYTEFTVGGSIRRNWDSISGTLRIDSLQGGRIGLSLQNVRVQARGTDQATGAFTINATGHARTSFGPSPALAANSHNHRLRTSFGTAG